MKETSPWERDAKVLHELERALHRVEFGAIVVDLLGLDDGKDRGQLALQPLTFGVRGKR